MPHFQPIDKELLEWMQEPYERNPWHPEHLIHQSISGNMVRSKSEAMIDAVLFQYKIPYRYECPVELGDVIYYPDFTTRGPKTGIVKFWEHNGFMDNPAYCRRSFLKQQQYAEHGIIPGINMIVTYETKEHPLTFKMIQEIVERHILE